MATWDDLEAELDLWHAAGEQPTFWWRDDDAEAPTDALGRLIALTGRHNAPLHLAVIPVAIDRGLAPMLKAAPHVWSTQHGFAHKNHEPKGMRASEVGVSRDLDLIHADLRTGWQRMQAAELPNLIPVIVPPWTRIGEQVLPHLNGWGYPVLSTFDRRPCPAPVAGLTHYNAHIEPLRWRPDARFAGEEKTLAQCVTHLRQRRTEGDASEPTGLLTHHLQTPDEVWDFCDALVTRLNHKNRVRWITLNDEMKEQSHG
ncbi:hypothetical protein Z946_2358 [Sulfitobacter noctilucicola]|uniref:Polysaccharide deacetylase n=1 Tax=Sulfitobacter noctilucicola TaxID=1342301 RepID=A0A7W6M9M5_9RHOB|nr:polysaccharide deacetylase family protein [Sulfitobacter noctilucicola]KIN63486.1 hypothetical protein Z946_2358 [Sulfitobacter noctilucicola]MBB4175003.1 hypothetical protein [Sulfitobacter noctilucicola]